MYAGDLMPTMKVLFTLDTLANGGTEKSTLDIIRHFSKDTDARVVTFYPGDDLRQDYIQAGIPLIDLHLTGKRSFTTGIRKLIRLIRQEKPDLIVSSILRANLISRIACLITRTPLVGTFVNDSYGDIRVQEFRDKGQYGRFRFFWLLDRWTSGIPGYWISNAASIALSNAEALHLHKKNITVIYRGRDTTQFPAWSAPNGTTFRFVFIGRLLERKGLAEMLEAYHQVQSVHPDVHLDIYGNGLFRKKMEETIGRLGLSDKVTLHGTVPGGWKKLYGGHCFLFPSWYEGFSGSLVEAMIAGIPIIASDIPMNREAVDDSTALIFPMKDKNALAACMEKMIREYPAMTEMGKRARLVATGRYDIRAIAGQYESFLHKVAGRTVQETDLLSIPSHG